MISDRDTLLAEGDVDGCRVWIRILDAVKEIREIARAEACRQGRVAIFTGPVYPASPTIGPDRLPVPRGFFQIVIDPTTEWALGF